MSQRLSYKRQVSVRILGPFVEELSRRPAASLVACIAELVMNQPETLTVFGVKGFAPDDTDDEW
jgi:hypothetical protein